MTTGPYETNFNVKTTKQTRTLIEKILFKKVAERGHPLITKAQAFIAVVAKWAKAEGIAK